MGFIVYALYNKKANKIYVGQTQNLSKRLQEHNQKRGNHYTAKVYGDWNIIYKEDCNNRREAIIRERQLKSYKGRQFLKKLIFN